jgi:autotransporter-associated beta strand protein
LTKAGPGTLVLGNSTTGTTTVTNGTLAVNGTSTTSGNIWVGFGDAASGNLTVNSGAAVTANVVLIGAGGSPTALASGTGTLASGGTINTAQWFVIGQSGAAGSSGDFTINGGTLNVHTNAAATGNLEMGTFDAASATLNINAGSNLKLLNNAAIVFGAQGNHSGTSIVNQNGGNVTFYSNNGTTVGGTGRLVMASAANSTGNYTYNLNGGILTVPRIARENTANNPTTVFNFNGGTLKPTASQSDFVSSLSRSNIRNGGAIIDTTGFTVTVAQPLLHSDIAGDNAVDGGLTKTGVGTLQLNGANSYTGATTVSAGTLKLTQSSRTTSGLIVANGAVASLTPRTAGVKTLQVGTLNLNTTGALDLADNDLVVDSGSYTTIRALVIQGLGPSTTGIDSSTSTGATRLALFDNALVNLTSWNGGTIAAGAIVGKYTYFGDVNIDGQVTGDDYTVVDSNLNTTPATGLEWVRGDANTDYSVTGDDYTVIDSNLGLGVGNPLTTSFLTGSMPSGSLSAIPEPASLGVLGISMMLLGRRMRRSSDRE